MTLQARMNAPTYPEAVHNAEAIPTITKMPAAPLLLVNHWLNRFHARIRDSKEVNAYKVLGPRLKACESERSMIPNFVAINFYNYGDLFKAVAELNGLS